MGVAWGLKGLGFSGRDLNINQVNQGLKRSGLLSALIRYNVLSVCIVLKITLFDVKLVSLKSRKSNIRHFNEMHRICNGKLGFVSIGGL